MQDDDPEQHAGFFVVKMEDLEILAKNIREINGQTSLSYRREKRKKHSGYRWRWDFSIKNLETGFFLCASGRTPEKAISKFIKIFYERGGSERYFNKA